MWVLGLVNWVCMLLLLMIGCGVLYFGQVVRFRCSVWFMFVIIWLIWIVVFGLICVCMIGVVGVLSDLFVILVWIFIWLLGVGMIFICFCQGGSVLFVVRIKWQVLFVFFRQVVECRCGVLLLIFVVNFSVKVVLLDVLFGVFVGIQVQLFCSWVIFGIFGFLYCQCIVLCFVLGIVISIMCLLLVEFLSVVVSWLFVNFMLLIFLLMINDVLGSCVVVLLVGSLQLW